MRPMIKICGLTDAKDAFILNENQVDFAGFVLFFEKSKRNLTIPQAQEIMSRLDDTMKKVAVTVSPTLQQVKEIQAAGFDYIQIHGNLTNDVLKECELPILRAVNVERPEDCMNVEHSDKIFGYVFDGKNAGEGKCFDWSYLQNFDRNGKKLMLAGGLNPNNLSRAIQTVAPDIVDVSSDVELPSIQTEQGMRSPGKDGEKVEAFVAAVRNVY